MNAGERYQPFVFVYVLLRALIIICMVRELINGDYINAMFCVLSLILFLLPYIIEKKFKIDFPEILISPLPAYIPYSPDVLIFIFAYTIYTWLQLGFINYLGVYTEIVPYSFKNFYLKNLYMYFDHYSLNPTEDGVTLDGFLYFITNKIKRSM